MNGRTIPKRLILADDAMVSGSGNVFTGSGAVIWLLQPGADVTNFRAEATADDAYIGVYAGSIISDTHYLKIGNGLDTYVLQGDAAVESGATLYLDEGTCLRSSNTAHRLLVESGGHVEANGARLELTSDTWIVYSGGAITLKDCTVAGSLALRSGASISGSGNRFTGEGVIISVDADLDVDFSFIKEASDTARIGVDGVVSRQVHYSKLSAGIDTYQLLSSNDVQSGGTLILDEGVCLLGSSSGGYANALYIREGGRFETDGGMLDFSEATTTSDAGILIVYDGGEAELKRATVIGHGTTSRDSDFYVDDGATLTLDNCTLQEVSRFEAKDGANIQISNTSMQVVSGFYAESGASLSMNNTSMQGMLNLNAGAKLSGSGNVFTGSGCAIYVTGGTAVDFSSFRASATAEDAYISIASGDITGKVVYVALGEGLATYELGSSRSISSSGDLTLDAGVECRVTTVAVSGRLDLKNGASLSGNVSLNGTAALLEGSRAHFGGNIDLMSTGTAKLSNCSIGGALLVKDTKSVANIKGLTFTGQDIYRLGSSTQSFVGETSGLWKDFTVTQPNSYITIINLDSDFSTVLDKPPANVTYRLSPDTAATIAHGAFVDFADGVGVDMQGGCMKIAGTLTAYNSSVVDVLYSAYATKAGAAGHGLTLLQDGTFTVENGNILLNSTGGTLELQSNSKLEMTGGTLSVANGISVGYQRGSASVAEQQARLELDGTALMSQAAEEGQGDEGDYVTLGKAGVNISTYGEVILSNLSIAAGSTITTLSYAYKYKGDTIYETDVDLGENSGSASTSEVVNKSGCGIITASNVHFGAKTKLDIAKEGRLSLTNCSFGEGEAKSVTINLQTGVGDVAINNCDLSGVLITVNRQNGSMIDLSGNYWGTSDLDEIKKMIRGYDESCVTIGKVLSSAPSMADVTAPGLTLQAPQMTRLGEDRMRVSFSWSSSEKASYVLTVDGVQHKLSGTSHSLELTDGTHRWSLTATDTKGNSRTLAGSAFMTDTLPPEVTLNAPKVQEKLDNGQTSVTFSWSATDAEALELTLNGYVYTVVGNSQTFELEDGTYSWSLKATDANGNSTTVAGPELTLDSNAPVLTLAHSLGASANGKREVTFSWISSEKATYELSVDGKVVYTGSATAHKLTLAEGSHTWSLKATDISGNITTSAGESFELDATPPSLTLNAPQTQKISEGQTSVCFSWAATGASSYELTVDGVKHTLSTTGKTLTLTDGRHSWSVVAWDDAGNSTSLAGADFTLDALAPTLTLNAPKIADRENGYATVTLSWATGETSVSYTLKVDGKAVTLSSATATSHTLRLADGEHRYELTATDADGNVATKGSSFSFDSTAPELSLREPDITKVADGRIRVTLSWAGEAGDSYELEVDGKAISLAAGATSHTLELADGAHNYSVTATDSSGNSSTLSGSFSVDATAPALSLGTPAITKVAEGRIRVMLSWSTESGADCALVVDGKAISLAAGATSHTLELVDGAHSYSVTATDASNNARTAEGDFSFDATAPSLPELAAPRVQNKGGIAIFSWAAAEPGARYELRYRLGANGTWVTQSVDEDCTFTLRELALGHYEWQLRAVDEAGNASDWATGQDFSVEEVVLEVSLTQFETTTIGQDCTRVTLAWEASDVASYELWVDGKLVYSGMNTSYTMELSDGKHSYTLKATDDVGNICLLEGDTPVLDTTDPELTLLSPSGEKLREGYVKVTLRWMCNEAANYELYVDNKLVYTGTDTHYELEMEDGEHLYRVKATDAAGYEATLSDNFSFDATTPAVVDFTPTWTVIGKGTAQVHFCWTWETGTRYTISIDGGEPVDLWNSPSYTATLDDGEHYYTITATDVAGNSATVEGKPFIIDTEAKGFGFLEPAVRPLTSGKTEVTFQWVMPKGSILKELKVAGKTIKEDKICYDAATGIYSYTATLKDGAHEYSASALVGNNIFEKSATLVLDTQAPKLSLKKPTLSKVGEGRVIVLLSWSGETGALYRVFLQGEKEPAYVGYDTQCVLELPLDTAGKRYTITATDAAGNTTTSERTHKYALLSHDTISPELNAVTTNITKRSKGKATVQFSWSGKDDVTTKGLRYTLVVDGKKVYSGTAATRSVSLADGEHSYSVIVTDKAGNISEEKVGIIVTDDTAPVLAVAAPQLVYGADYGKGEATLSWGSDDVDATYTLTVDGRVVYEGKDKSYTLSLTDGKHSYAVTAADAVGNTSSAKKGSFTVNSADTLAPAAVELKSITTKKYKDALVKATITWEAPKGEKGLTYTLMVDGEIAYMGTSTNCTLTLADGKHSYSVIATDKAGNSSTAATDSFETGDVTAPVISDVSCTEDYKFTSLRNTAVTFNWKCEGDPVELELKVDGESWHGEHTEDGGYCVRHLLLDDGKYKYTITAKDSAGNQSTYSGTLVTDTKAPTVSLSKPRLSEGAGGTVDATLSWKGEKDATYTLTVDGRSVELSAPTASSQLIRGLSDGEHSYSVIATDAAGNVSAAATGSFFYDTTAPGIILDGITGAATTSKGITRTTATLSWAGEVGVSYTMKVDGNKLKVSKNFQGYAALTSTTGKLSAGAHHYSIIAEDKAGNVSEYSGVFVCDGFGELTMDGMSFSTVIPEGTQKLNWYGLNDAGFSSDATPTGAANGYSFELTEARQLDVKLSGLDEDATVVLQKAGGWGSITLKANAGSQLDRELSLSEGTYYLQVLDAEDASALASSYTLDLELEKSGSKQPQQQAYLA